MATAYTPYGSYTTNASNYMWQTTAANTDLVWRTWLTTSITSTATNILYEGAWQHWTSLADHQREKRADRRARDIAAQAQREAAQADLERQVREREAAYAQERTARQAADERARALLVACLDEAQRAEYAAHGYFTVTSDQGKSYRIYQGTHGNVYRLGPDGTTREMGFCAQPAGVPDCDAMLAQKLALETDEAAFLRIANARQP